ncbi:MAG TPA: ABC transporter permease subunit [Tepidisphaeraceae bacterium]|jgi:hypothetical protein
MPPILQQSSAWLIAFVIVAALAAYGFRDLLRFSMGRVWAISDVCFRDAIRRRVLWITPLAMLGIVVVSQLQKPENEQDAIRLTIKFCFFATAVVVLIISVITGATNLPREIESRVIYTIVVKPVSRLEIIFGKILGFARVSGTILLIMGLFTLGYLHLRAYALGRQITRTLESPAIDGSTRDRLQHYSTGGLLLSQSIEQPARVAQYARLTEGNTLDLQGTAQDVTGLFINDPASPAGGIAIHVGYEQIGEAETGEAAAPVAAKPAVAVSISDERGNPVLPPDQMPGGGRIQLTDPTGSRPATLLFNEQQMAALLQTRDNRLVVRVSGQQPNFIFKFDRENGVSLVRADAGGAMQFVKSERPLMARGSEGRSGQQLAGPTKNIQPVQVFGFERAGRPAGDQNVPFELTVGIERRGEDESDDATTLEIVAIDRKSGAASAPQIVFPESRATLYFNLPAEFVQNGDFDVRMTNKTPGHVIGIGPRSVTMIGGTEYFGFNLVKGLLVVWMLSILTATIALFCSTFLSWPIAVVLTLLVILGRWIVSSLEIGTGLGSQFATELFPNNAAGARTVSSAVDTLTNALTAVANVLPDLSSFGITEQIERGVMISPSQLLEPLLVVLIFGLPFAAVGYVFLRNKEVAP